MESAYRISFFGDEVEQITHFDPLTGEVYGRLDDLTTFPATQYVTSKPTIERAADEIRHELEEQVEATSSRRASCSRRTGSASAPSTTWR